MIEDLRHLMWLEEKKDWYDGDLRKMERDKLVRHNEEMENMMRSGKEELESGLRSEIHHTHGEHGEIGRREYYQLSQWVKTGQECGSNDNIADLLLKGVKILMLGPM
ncbi:hypothetical protein Tco_1303000 [Tanacetum coccineum]